MSQKDIDNQRRYYRRQVGYDKEAFITSLEESVGRKKNKNKSRN